MPETNIDSAVLLYVESEIKRNSFPTRSGAISDVTGRLNVLPSAVSASIKGLIAAGRLVHRTSDDQLVPKG